MDTLHNSYHQSIFTFALRLGRFGMLSMTIAMMLLMMLMTTMPLSY
jgi:hypothetical protein